MDALFQLLARLTPSSSDVTGRANLAKEVFKNVKAKKTFGQKTCDELAGLLQGARGDQWEKARLWCYTSALPLFTRAGTIDHRPVHRGHRKIRSEKVSTHSTQTSTELTRTRPQPFRLTSNSVHANNFLYSHPLSLDHIYLDCGGLVVNIQDGVSCDHDFN